jgi:hypothetical protein
VAPDSLNYQWGLQYPNLLALRVAVFYPLGHPTLYASGNNLRGPGILAHFGTLNPRFNESEGTKDFVLYTRGFVVGVAFYYEINYRWAKNQVLYCRNFVIEGVIIPRF